MNAIVLNGSARAGAAPVPLFGLDDPLDPDQPTDVAITTSRRGLTRLALVAAETGARFQREAVGHDPMAWLQAPRRLFAGATALEACLDRDHCLRAVLLHGLSIGLDADPARIDALLCDHQSNDGVGDGGGEWGDDGGREHRPPPIVRRLRLYSALMVIARGGELVHLFHASVAPSAGVVRERIRSRFGTAAADQAEIQIGVDLDCPDTLGLLPPAFRRMMERGRRIRWSTMSTLDVTVEHRIPS